MQSTALSGVVAALLHQRHEPGAVVRIARTAAGWSQADLGQRCGYSASQVSRWERGRVPLRDVTLLYRLAAVLDLPPVVFGLADQHTWRDTIGVPTGPARSGGHKVCCVPMPGREEDDPVHRRMLLLAAGLGGTSPAGPHSGITLASGIDIAELLAHQLGDVLLGPDTAAEPVTVTVLRDAFTAAQRDFSTCQYVPLASRLPALIKLEASGLEWISADRGLHAARCAEDALTFAEAQRLVASVARRAGHHDRALVLTLAAADHLDISTQQPSPEHLAMYGMLHCSAGYAAARAGHRDRANDLLGEAEATARRLTGDPGRHRGLVANIVSHRVSSASVLGDAGTALAHARSLPIAAIPTVERRARLLVDTAMSYAQWDKPDRAYATLLVAERCAPGEVRTRNAVRRLVTDLMATPRQAAMPGLRELATRVHATA